MRQRFLSAVNFVLITFLVLSYVSCKQEADVPSASSIPRAYWGSWIQMYTGTEYYIDNSKVYQSSSSNKKYREISSGVGNYRLDSDDVLKNGNTVYFRKGGSTRSFSVQVAGFSDSYSTRSVYPSRSVGTGKQGVSGRRQNKDNAADNQSGQSNSNGTITFTDAVAGDTQTVTVVNTTVEVSPKYSGENIGTIPIVENGMYGFKTTYTIDSDAEGFCYGNYYKTYNLKLNINHIIFL